MVEDSGYWDYTLRITPEIAQALVDQQITVTFLGTTIDGQHILKSSGWSGPGMTLVREQVSQAKAARDEWVAEAQAIARESGLEVKSFDD